MTCVYLKEAAESLGRRVPQSTLDCLASLLWQLLVSSFKFGVSITQLPFLQVFGLDKMGVIPLLRKLTGANHSIDREALWEAAETYHRLHQVANFDAKKAALLTILLRWSCVHLEGEQCMGLPLP